MDFGIAGRRTVVIGGTGALGGAAAEALAAEKVDLVLFSRNRERLEHARRRRRFGVSVEIHPGDITREADVDALAAAVVAWAGRRFLVLRKLAPRVAAGGGGESWRSRRQASSSPCPGHAISTVFRAGVQAAVKHLAMELAERGVTVNAVAPATVLTPTFSQFHNLHNRVELVPLKRARRPVELGRHCGISGLRPCRFHDWAGDPAGRGRHTFPVLNFQRISI